MCGYSDGSTASTRSRLTVAKSWIDAVVHPQPACRGGRDGSSSAAPAHPIEARMCAKTSGDSTCARELAQVAVVPGRLDAVEDAGVVADAVPADAEAVAVGRLGPQPRVQALVDQRVLRPVQQLLDQDRRAGVCEPATHLRLLSCQWWKLDAAELSWIGCGCCWRRGSCRFRSLTSMSAMSCVKPCLTTTRSGQVGPLLRERVGRDEPAALAQRAGDVEDREVVDAVAQREGEHRQLVSLREQLERAELRDQSRQARRDLARVGVCTFR